MNPDSSETFIASSETYFYTAYGLTFQSPVRLPALVSTALTLPQADVIIRIDKLDFPDYTFDDAGFALIQETESIFLIWRNVAKFRVQEGSEIVIDPAPGVREDILRLFIQGTTLAILLYQRGLFLFHGSAVSVDGRAAVFVGDGGAGKSTTSATLYKRGHRFVADDIVAIDVREPGPPMVIPGYPQAKLWTQSVISLGDEIDSMTRLRPELDKFAWQTRDTFSLDPLPLGCTYILGKGDALDIKEISGQTAILMLVRYLYVTRFGDNFNSPERSVRHLHQAGQIARQTPIRALIRETDLSALDNVAKRIEEDFNAESDQSSGY